MQARMTLGQALWSVVGQYARFRGRARRSEYGWFMLCFWLNYALVAAGQSDWFITAQKNSVVSVISAGLLMIVPPLLVLLVIVPTVALGVRRLHDTGRSGWFLLFSLVPLAGFVLFLLLLTQDGQPGANGWGRDPRS
jgi:uncharacterized membrane protein YhaH (DUF805 family)